MQGPSSGGLSTQQPELNPFAVLGFAVSFFVGPLGFLFGTIALAQIRTPAQEGRGLAVAAIVIGTLQVLVLAMWVGWTG